MKLACVYSERTKVRGTLFRGYRGTLFRGYHGFRGLWDLPCWLFRDREWPCHTAAGKNKTCPAK